ncbi:MAG: hypothetical protein KJ749_07795 [Planctomycetes bacterium]|nr:hypothetical protein [Planctomycetota bacterium]
MIGKARLSVILPLALLWAPVPAATRAADVLCLGVGRGYDNADFFQLVMTGSSLATVHEALVGDGFSFVATESFGDVTLSDYDIVFMGLLDPAEALTDQERAALESFVRAGGAFIYLGDNDIFTTPNRSVASLFDVSYSTNLYATSATGVANPSHPIIDGVAGRVAEYNGAGNLPGFFGGIDRLGAYAQPILTTETHTIVAAIDRSVLGPGSGPVVFLADANGFLDNGLGTIGFGDNLTLMRNIFAWASGECEGDSDCDDGLFCNGSETCVNHVCRPGGYPCGSGQVCLEDQQTCGACAADGQCDDGLYCNGAESCDGTGVCQPGDDPCPTACEHCDEESATCQWCVFDLDQNGVIGSGDFAFFSGCMGECYPPGDPCVVANFDNDPDNCVGSGDFAGFSGCFGLTCAECEECAGPTEGARSAKPDSPNSRVALEVVALATASTDNSAEKLPTSGGSFPVGESFYLELWAKRSGSTGKGLASVYVDLRFDPAALTVVNVASSDNFPTFPRGVVDSLEGIVTGLGGSVSPRGTAVGSDGKWVRVATIQVQALQAVATTIVIHPADAPFGVGIVGEFGTLAAPLLDSGRLDMTFYSQISRRTIGGRILEPARSFETIPD